MTVDADHGAPVTTGEDDRRGIRPQPFDEEDHRLALRYRINLYCQIIGEPVSFEHVAKAWWIRSDPRSRAGEEEKRVSRFLEQLARARFAERHGGIERDYMATSPWACCALTGDHRVHSVLNTGDYELVALESQIHQLCRDAHRAFAIVALGGRAGARPLRRFRRGSAAKAGRDLAGIGEMLYSVLTHVMAAASGLQDEGAGRQERDDMMRAVRSEWTSVRATVEGMIQRQARFEYFQGVGLGAVLIVPLLVLGGWLAARHGGNHFSDPVAFTAALIGGAAGAVISVTQRMTTKTLVIDFTARKNQKIALGALRPLVGAVLAAVVCFAVMGGLLAVETRSGAGPAGALAFYAVAGFAAGFSERFATDVLEGATAKLVRPVDPSPIAGSSASVTGPSRSDSPGPADRA